MFRNMVTSLFKYQQIRTTDVKAKELRRWADHMITLAKRGDLHARRQALAIIPEKQVVHKLFEDASQNFGSRSGGYTRIVKIGHRKGDAAPLSLVELIITEKSKKKKTTKKKAKTAPPKASATDKKEASSVKATETVAKGESHSGKGQKTGPKPASEATSAVTEKTEAPDTGKETPTV